MRVVLTIAGSDSSGGAGVQADIKTIAAHRMFAETAITALTAQNTLGVHAVEDVSPAFVEQQIDAVFDDIRPHAVKIGMVSSPEIVESIANALERNQADNIVVDPVMVATSGSTLIASEAVERLVARLFPLASLITPNLDEAEVLCGHRIVSEDDAESAARLIAARCHPREGEGNGAVLVKGGHGLGDPAASDDLLLLPDGNFRWLRHRRIDTDNTHGTGCTLSAAVACGLAEGLLIEDAVLRAKRYVSGALAADLNFGRGSGPLDHMWAYRDTCCRI